MCLRLTDGMTSLSDHSIAIGYHLWKCSFMSSGLQNLSGAREDILLAMHLDPLNAEVISLMSRLFPGKTATDVLHSSMAQEAKKAAENLVVKSSPVKLDSL